MAITFSKNNQTGHYECEYAGKSGGLQLMRAGKGRFTVYGHAGIDYTIIYTDAEAGANILRYLDMRGLCSIKMVSESMVINAVIKEE